MSILKTQFATMVFPKKQQFKPVNARYERNWTVAVALTIAIAAAVLLLLSLLGCATPPSGTFSATLHPLVTQPTPPAPPPVWGPVPGPSIAPAQ